MTVESTLDPTAAACAEDQHQLALDLHTEGRSLEAMRVLADDLRGVLGDVESLNDLGVIATAAGALTAGEAALRTAELLGGDEAASANLEAVDEIRGTGFIARLMLELVAWSASPNLPDNFDPLIHRDGPPGPPHPLEDAVTQIMRDAPALEELYHVLADDASRQLMVRLFAARLLGPMKVPMPFSGTQVRELNALPERLEIPAPAAVDLNFLGWSTKRYDLAPLGHPVIADLHTKNVVETFVLEQYACPEHPEARAAAGDVVIDGGGCYGDSALYFANRVGPTGRVISFEFTPQNLSLFESNLELNPLLAPNIQVQPRALWSRSGDRLSFDFNGPGTSVTTSHRGAFEVQTQAIDDLRDRVDFIKLDVEGAELAVLQGAEQTLRRDLPKLAIAIYHKPSDWVEIPAFLRGLGLGYRFSIRHFTINYFETVLYAWVDNR